MLTFLCTTKWFDFMAQTVPKCQVLYKNSFTYHTSQETPPPFEDSFSFLGEDVLHFVIKL